MKIKNDFIAKALGKMGVKVNAELVIDDSNGTSLTFPDIAEVSELAIGVATTAPDGTYVIADGDNTITIVVINGLIESKDVVEPAPAAEASTELEAETQQLLSTLVEAHVSQNAKIEALEQTIKDLKVSLKHEDGKAPAAAADKSKQPSFKIVG